MLKIIRKQEKAKVDEVKPKRKLSLGDFTSPPSKKKVPTPETLKMQEESRERLIEQFKVLSSMI